MNRSIVDIFVFKTPFESTEIFLEKYNKILSMFWDYCINAWLEHHQIQTKNELYTTLSHISNDKNLEVKFSIKNHFDENNFFPWIMINYFLNEHVFDKENIEFFLNDNIKFIHNVYFNEFFIEYDTQFKIHDINQWKKVSYEQLKQFNTENKYSKENKLILDSLMFLYFSLIKNLHQINNNIEEINTISQKNMYIDAAKITHDITKENLLKNLIKIEQQINTFIQLLH